MVTRFISISFIFFLVLSCESKEKKRSLTTKKYPNGKIQSEINYLDDSIRDGITRLYDKQGILHDEINYKSGLINGWWIQFYPSGSIQNKRMFSDGIQNGSAFFYFENGKLEHEEFWLNGQVFGSSYWFYPSGLLESYAASDFDGHVRYKIDYDSSGNKKREEGKIVGQIASNGIMDNQNGIIDSIKLKEGFHGRVSVATPPNCTVRLFMGTMENKMLVQKSELPIKSSMAAFNHRFTNAGLHQVVFIGQIVDSSGQLLKSDTVQGRVLVK